MVFFQELRAQYEDVSHELALVRGCHLLFEREIRSGSKAFVTADLYLLFWRGCGIDRVESYFACRT